MVLGVAAVLSLYLGWRFVGVCRYVGVTTRDSRMDMGQVLVVQNHGEHPALCAVEIDGVHCERFLLEEGESKEFGILETDRVLDGGTTGRLSVEGYRRGLRFSLENKFAAVSGKSVHSVAKAPTEAYAFAAGIPLAFGQKPSRIGGAGRNLSGAKELGATWKSSIRYPDKTLPTAGCRRYIARSRIEDTLSLKAL